VTTLPNPIWVTLPKDADDEPARGIYDGDSYIVELADGEQVWAVYSRAGGFELCDDEGNAIDEQRNPLDHVDRVMIRGYLPGFGPICPKAGAAPEIHLVVIQPQQLAATKRLLDRVIVDSMRIARRMLGERYHAHPPLRYEPITSSERDTRHHDSA
jgi:hypothetical protein